MAQSCVRIFCTSNVNFQSRVRAAGATQGFCLLNQPPVSIRCHTRPYSSSQRRLGFARSAASRLQWVNEKYDKFLQRRFPRFHALYRTFIRGFRLFFDDVREVQRIRIGMIRGSADHQNLPYRDMEKLRQFRRDVIKAVPLVIISLPPFANYIVFLLMYLYPRQLLMRHFWTPQQLLEFRGVYHAQRAGHHAALLSGLEAAPTHPADGRVKKRLLEICRKVRSGAQPTASDLHAVRTLFSGPPLGVRRMSREQMKRLCTLLFLSTRLPAFCIAQRLNSHALELMRLDRALMRLGLHQLDDTELKEACYTRGLNVGVLTCAQCRDWLSEWLQFSIHLEQSETSLYLHAMMLLSVNQPQPPPS